MLTNMLLAIVVNAPGAAIAGGGDEGDMSPQYSDRGDDILHVPPKKKIH